MSSGKERQLSATQANLELDSNHKTMCRHQSVKKILENSGSGEQNIGNIHPVVMNCVVWKNKISFNLVCVTFEHKLNWHEYVTTP